MHSIYICTNNNVMNIANKHSFHLVIESQGQIMMQVKYKKTFSLQ